MCAEYVASRETAKNRMNCSVRKTLKQSIVSVPKRAQYDVGNDGGGVGEIVSREQLKTCVFY